MRHLIVAFVLMVAMTGFDGSSANAETPPEQAAVFVTDLGNAAINVLAGQSGDLAAREAGVRQLLRENFALNQIGKFVLGRAWRKASDAQKREYLALFSEYVLATYAKRFGGYSGESFQIVGSEKVGKQDALVLTKISRPSGPPLEAGWRVRQTNGQFRIIDVVVEGVSMVAAQRAEFGAIVKAQGLDGLLQTLRLQVSKFAAQAS